MDLPKIITNIDEVNELLSVAKKYQDSLLDTFIQSAVQELPRENIDLASVQQHRFLIDSYNEFQHVIGARALSLSTRHQLPFGVYPSYFGDHGVAFYKKVRQVPAFLRSEIGGEVAVFENEVPDSYTFGVVSDDYIARIGSDWGMQKGSWGNESSLRTITLDIRRRQQ